MASRLIAAMLVGALATAVSAAEPTTGTDTLEHITSTYDGTSQPYRLFVPAAASTGSLPLLVVLHGKGVDQDAWFDFTPVKEHAARHGCIVAAPHGRGNWFYRGPAEQDVLDTIAEVKAGHPVDADRVYLAGHSMGGWGTWWIGLRHAHLFAGIAPMAGWAPEDLLPAAANLNPFIIHDEGDKIVPVEMSREPAARLAELGIPHNYREETGYGHESRMIGDNFDRLFDYMNGAARTARPESFTVVSRGGAAGAGWGVSIRATDATTMTGVVSVSLTGADGVAVATTGVRCLQLDGGVLGGGRRVVVDGAEAGVLGPGRLTLARADGAWKAMPGDGGAPCDNGLGRVIARGPLAEIQTTGSSDGLTTAVAGLLLPGLECDCLLLPDDQFFLPPGPLTVGKLLDLGVYPDERLVRVVIPGKELDSVVDFPPYGKLRVFPAKGPVEDMEQCRVVMPRYAVRRLARTDGVEVLDGTIPSRLLDANAAHMD